FPNRRLNDPLFRRQGQARSCRLRTMDASDFQILTSEGSPMSTKSTVRPNPTKVVPMTTSAASPPELLRHYGRGPTPSVGTENAFCERHLLYDRVIDPKVPSARERLEAF